MKCLVISRFKLPQKNNKCTISWTLKYTSKRWKIQVLLAGELIDIFLMLKLLIENTIEIVVYKLSKMEIAAGHFLSGDEKFNG